MLFYAAVPSISSDMAPYIALAGVLVGLLFRWWADIQAHKRELKKATYTELVHSLSRAVRAISMAPDPLRPMRDVGDQFSESLAPLSAAQVVARLPLSCALTALHSELLRLSQALYFQRATLDPLHESYMFLQSRFQKVVAEIDRWEGEFEALKISQPNDVAHLRRLDALIKKKVDERERLREAMTSKGQEAAKQVAVCCTTLASGMRNYPELLTDVISQVRRELGFRFDQEGFLSLQKQANSLAQELMKSSVEGILKRNGLEPE